VWVNAVKQINNLNFTRFTSSSHQEMHAFLYHKLISAKLGELYLAVRMHGKADIDLDSVSTK
jgi:hypothetical protein